MAEYDAMGNYTGYNDSYQPVAPFYDSFGSEVLNDEKRRLKEEELKRQIEEYNRQQNELASEVSHKQEITTYGDGSRTVKTQREIPAAGLGRGYVNPPAAQAQPVAPVAPAADQSAYTAQMESGNNPNIGYHDRTKGSAYGTYGLTSAAYQDVQRANPQFAGRDITTLTPEEQTQAYRTYTGLNANALQRFGVEPTAANQRLAHFLGAKGAAEFLKNGTVSPAAAAANGGEDNVRRIAQARLGGGVAPASGAASLVAGEQGGMPTAPVAPTEGAFTGQGLKAPTVGPAPTARVPSSEQFVTRYQDTQTDPAGLMKLATDDTAPDWIKERARNRAADLITEQRDTMKAKEALAAATPNDLARYLQGKTKSGEDYNLTTRIRAMLFSASGNNELAMREWNKLDNTGTDKYVQGADGQSYLLRTRANGEVMGGFNAKTGAALTPEEIVNVSAGVQTQKGVHQAADTYADPTGKIKGNFVLETRPGQAPVFKEVGTGRVATAAEGAVLRKIGVTGTLEDQLARQRQKLMTDLQFVEPTKRMEFAARFDAEHGTNFAGELKNQMPGSFGGQPAQATTVAPSVAASGGAPAGQAVSGPVAPTGNIPTGPIAPGAAITKPVAGMTPAQIKQQETLGTEAGKAGIAVGETEQKEFVKDMKPAIGTAASDGQMIGSARRQQLDLIKSNPSILNIMNGDGTRFDQARNIITRIATGAYSDENKEALYKDVKATGLSQAEQGALLDFANLNTGINAKTLKANSGAGSISNAEQQANKDANIGNVDRIPAYAALSGLHRSQFSGDLAASKQAFLDTHPDIKTTSQFNSAWAKEEANLLKGYQGIAKARFDVMGRAPEVGASKEAIAAYKDRVFRAFEAYPAPKWDAATGKWDYQTANAKRAAMRQILGQ